VLDTGQLNVVLNIATVVFTGGALGVVLKHRYGMRGLTNADSADIRDHYAEELERVVKRQRDCEAREEALRGRVAELENNILGLIGIIRQASADRVLELGEGASEVIRDMAERVNQRRSAALSGNPSCGEASE
jgi:hypothetical protein